MNENEYYSQLLLWAKSQRTAFLNSEKYGFFSIQIILQLLNLMENNLRVIDLELECYKMNIELISLYKDYLDLHEENFKSQETEQLKNSLNKSLYAAIVPELISFEIKNLIPNKKESFLLLPLSIAFYNLSESTWNFHEISCKIQNKNGFIQLEFFDKAHQFNFLRKNSKQPIMDPNLNLRNKRDIVNYFYIVPWENLNKLTKILSLGTTNIQTQINGILIKKEKLENYQEKEKLTPQEVFFSEINDISINEHYGDITSTTQEFLGNCLIKELDSALKLSLGERKFSEISKINYSPSFEGIQAKYLYTSKIPGVSSTKEIYLSLIAILIDRLDTLKFDTLMSRKIMLETFSIYSYLKHCRENSPMKKKLQTYLTNQFYKKQDLSIQKLAPTNFHTDDFQINRQNIDSLQEALTQKTQGVPENLRSLNKEIKNEKRSERKKLKNSIKCQQDDHTH